MKKIILSLSLLILFVNIYSQETNKSLLTKEDYLQKSRNQKRTANILLLGGAALDVIGLVFPPGEKTESSFFWDSHKNDGIRGAFLLTGTVAMLVSIPFYISAAKNKRRANALTLRFKNENILFPIQNHLAIKKLPGLSLKIIL